MGDHLQPCHPALYVCPSCCAEYVALSRAGAFAMCRESVRQAAVLSLGMLPWSEATWAALLAWAQAACPQQGAACEAIALLAASEGAPQGAMGQALGALLPLLTGACPAAAAEVRLLSSMLLLHRKCCLKVLLAARGLAGELQIRPWVFCC